MQFQTQISTLLHWLDQWSECSKTIAVVTLLTKLAPVSAKFVSIALQQSLSNLPQLELQEQEANNPGFISSLLEENKDSALAQLLTHVPLLHPNNTDAKTQYLCLLESLLPYYYYASETSSCYEKIQQLFTYIVIHPAFKHEKEQLLLWRKFLENASKKMVSNKSNPDMKIPPYCDNENKPIGLCTGSFDSIFSTDGAMPVQTPCEAMRTKRSSSLTPPILFPGSLSEEFLAQGSRRLSLSDQVQSYSILSPNSSLCSSSSESQLDDLKAELLQRDVKVWLKYLRLHKYGSLFAPLTYEQILSINENTFDSIMDPKGNVTQGAKRKIIASIRKLNDRYSVLCHLEQDVTNANLKTLKHVMLQIKAILFSPMKLVPEEDALPSPPTCPIPEQLCKVLCKVYTQFYMLQITPEDYGELCSTIDLFVSSIGIILNSRSFNKKQKTALNSLKISISISLSKTPKTHGYLFRPSFGAKPCRTAPGSPLTRSPTTPHSQQGPSPSFDKPPPPTEFEHLVRSVVELGME